MAGCVTQPAIYDERYVLVESGMRSAVRKELPVLIHAVDGQITFSPRYPTPLKPGKHLVDVYFSTGVGAPDKQWRALELDAAPCTRYRVVARYTNLTHVEWEPVIYPEPIGECVAKFERSS
jgi:hypothetical protein